MWQWLTAAPNKELLPMVRAAQQCLIALDMLLLGQTGLMQACFSICMPDSSHAKPLADNLTQYTAPLWQH